MSFIFHFSWQGHAKILKIWTKNQLFKTEMSIMVSLTSKFSLYFPIVQNKLLENQKKENEKIASKAKESKKKNYHM